MTWGDDVVFHIHEHVGLGDGLQISGESRVGGQSRQHLGSKHR